MRGVGPPTSSRRPHPLRVLKVTPSSHDPRVCCLDCAGDEKCPHTHTHTHERRLRPSADAALFSASYSRVLRSFSAMGRTHALTDMGWTGRPHTHTHTHITNTPMSATKSTLLALSCVGVAASIALALNVTAKGDTNVSIGDESPRDTPKEIKEELLSRVRSFFGDEGSAKINNSFVIVVGLGGVGSHCAHMICRSGVGKLRLIDFDQVTLSSLNRHAVATLADVGTSKAAAMRQHLQAIVPWCDVEAATEMFTMSEAERLLSGKPDLVIDCIDDVNTKAELIAFCKHNQIPVVTSMGAGGKSDPTRMRIAPISDCINDPLAQKIKWKLKKHGVSAEEVLCVFSIEKPVCQLLPLDEEQKNAPQDFGAVDYLRLRIIPVLGTSPSIFGQTLAAYALCTLGGKPFEPEVCERISKNLKHKLRQVFRNNELSRVGHDKDIDMDDEDLEFIVQTVWKSRCAVTQKRFGGHAILTLTRWDASAPPTPYNLVLVQQEEAKRLAQMGKAAAFSPEIIARIETRLQWAKEICLDAWNNPNALVPVNEGHNRRRMDRLQSQTNRLSCRQMMTNAALVLAGAGVGAWLASQL